MKRQTERRNPNAPFQCSETKTNIFLIGDSIRLGYCNTVKDALSDIAEVFYFSDNCRSTQYAIFNMSGWADMFDDPCAVDIVHFNCGHWDAAHFHGAQLSLTSLDEYARNMDILIKLLKKFFPNATLVFATTTPMNPDTVHFADPNPRSDEELDAYNRTAVAAAEKHGVLVSDLNAYMRDCGSDAYIDACHYTADAFAHLGEEVARRLKHIARRKPL